MRGLPGKFARRDIGRRKNNIEGWRDFDPLHPEAVVYGNGTSHALTQLDGNVTVNANREIVATFKDVISSAETTMPTCDVYSIPLRNKDGTPITFADSFTLKTQLEIVSTSGDIENVTNKQTPFLGMGFGQHADIGDSSNHYITNGLWLHNLDSGVIRKRVIKFKTTDVDTHSTITANDSSNRPADELHLVVEYFVGPSIGATHTDDDNVVAISWLGKNASNNYTKTSSGSLGEFELSNANGVFVRILRFRARNRWKL